MAMRGQGQQVSQGDTQSSRLRKGILVFAIIFTATLTIVGMSTQGLGSDVSLILSGFGVMLGLFQLLVPLPGSPPLVSRLRKSDETNTEFEALHKQLEKAHKSTDKGALVIFARKSLVGGRVTLRPRSDNLSILSPKKRKEAVSTYITERSVNQHIIYAAVFQNLEPDIYHVEYEYGISSRYVTAVTIQAGEVLELRWLSPSLALTLK